MEAAGHGLIAGISIALLGIAFWAPFAAARVFHLALGGIYVAVPLVAWACDRHGVAPLVSIATAVIVGTGISAGCELFNHRPLSKQRASSSVHLASSLGLYLILVQVVTLAGGSDTRQLRTAISTSVALGSASFARTEILGAAVAALVVICALIGSHLTGFGLRIRGLADNPDELALRGYNIDGLRLISFVFSGLLCSSASLIAAYDIGFDPQRGLSAILPAAVAVFFGGTSTIWGPVVGGLSLGLVGALILWTVSAQWQQPVTFAAVIILLLVSPRGVLRPRFADQR